MDPEVRRAVLQQFQDQGLFLERAALDCLTEYVASVKDTNGAIESLLDALELDDTSKVSKEVAVALINKHRGGSKDVDLVQVISAFDVPKAKFDSIRRTFLRDETPTTLFGSAQDKRQVLLDRLHLLQLRLARNPLFRRPVFEDPDLKDRSVQLTEVKALLGMVDERRTIMGIIRQLEDDRFFIQDESGSVPVDLSEAGTIAGFFVENCVVIAEGRLQHDGEMKVTALGMPPTEPREESLAAAQGVDFFGGEPLKSDDDLLKAVEWESEHEEDRIVFISDIWLDDPGTLPSLDAIFSGFGALDDVPSLFVLLGNFHSFSCTSASTDFVGVRSNFDSLASMLSRHTRILEGSRLVFVPGPRDPGSSEVLPQPPLPAALTAGLRAALPRAVFASNPCRLRYCSQQIIIFRDDLEKRMRRLCLLPPAGDQPSTAESMDEAGNGNEEGSQDKGQEGWWRRNKTASDAMFENLAVTITQQSHLCPLPLDSQAVYWQVDHAMWVYPLPHALVLADSAPAADFTERKSGCVCINPGSLKNGTFAAYNPSAHEAELCDVPEEEDPQGRP